MTGEINQFSGVLSPPAGHFGFNIFLDLNESCLFICDVIVMCHGLGCFLQFDAFIRVIYVNKQKINKKLWSCSFVQELQLRKPSNSSHTSLCPLTTRSSTTLWLRHQPPSSSETLYVRVCVCVRILFSTTESLLCS